MWQRIFGKDRPCRGIVRISLPTCSPELTLGKPTSGSGGDCRVGAFSVPSCSASASPSFSPHLSPSSQCHCGWGLRSVREGTIGGQKRWRVRALCPLHCDLQLQSDRTQGWGHESSMRGFWTYHRPQGPALPSSLPSVLPGWCDGSEVFPHGLDHSSPPNPEPCTNSNSSIKQQPDGSSCFLQDCTLFINQPQSYQGTNGITEQRKKVDELYKHCTYKRRHIQCSDFSVLRIADLPVFVACLYNPLVIQMVY